MIVTALFYAEDGEGFERRDFSEPSWAEISEALGQEPFSVWKSEYEAPPPPKEEPDVVEKESAEALLRRLIDEDEPHTENARFILALMLERKKQLKQTDTNHTGTSKLLIYEHANGGDVFIVRDPELSLKEVEKVQAEVAELLGFKKPGAEPEPEPEVPSQSAEGELAEGNAAPSPNGESAEGVDGSAPDEGDAEAVAEPDRGSPGQIPVEAAAGN